MKKKLFYSGLIALIAVLSSCGGQKTEHSVSDNKIKVGVSEGAESKLAETAKKVAKEKYNLEVELISFSDYILPNTALSTGALDLNVYQTIPFYEDAIAHNDNYKFAIVGRTFVYPLAAYSHKIKTVDELQDGSIIAIPNDPTNGGRALFLLQKQGLIKLKEGIGFAASTYDIVENPHHYKIIAIEPAQLPRALDDAALALINNNYAASAGLLLKDGVFAEDGDSSYVNVIVAREENKEDEKVKLFVQAYQSDEVLATAKEVFKDGVVKGW